VLFRSVGYYTDNIDLDPGPAVESHETMAFRQHESFVVKLAADGSFAWGGTFASQSVAASGDAGAVVIDGAGAAYVSVGYFGTVDLDPSAGSAVHSSYSSELATSAAALVKLTPAGKLAWVQSTEDTGSCVPAGGPLALATDGTILVLGGDASCTDGAAIASYRPDGTLRGYAGLGGLPAVSIAAGANGSVYIGGGAGIFADLDPGPGVARRLVGVIHPGGGYSPGGFIVKLGSDGSYLWDRTLVGEAVVAVAGAPDGGVIGLGSLGVTKLNADGTAGWTFSSGTFPGTVVSSGTGFVVSGSAAYESDLDPGPGTDIVGDLDLYLSRFNF